MLTPMLRLAACIAVVALAGCGSTNPGVPDIQDDIPVPHGFGRAADDEETRSYYEKHETFRNWRITYVGQAPAADVFDFYQKQLPLNGWKLENVTPDAAARGGLVSALKEHERAKVWVKPHTDGERAWVTVEIGYGK
jgi:hypothetical protein